MIFVPCHQKWHEPPVPFTREGPKISHNRVRIEPSGVGLWEDPKSSCQIRINFFPSISWVAVWLMVDQGEAKVCSPSNLGCFSV